MRYNKDSGAYHITYAYPRTPRFISARIRVPFMKLLIVEDEKMAREGLLQSLDWPEVGVSKVLSAENGEAGLFLAKRFLPDIVLTDIRMPRMDGITLAGRIRELLPACRIIFLSAYSEIDYYKAAIGLKAVRYLDKPVEAEELRAVVLDAVAECKQHYRYKTTSEQHAMREKQRLADAMCAGGDGAALAAECRRMGLLEGARCERAFVTAILVSLRLDFEEESREDLLCLAGALSEAADFPNLYTVRHRSRVVLFLFTPSELSAARLDAVCKRLQSALGQRVFSIAVGKPARGAANANRAYETAKAALAKAYCLPWGQALLYDGATEHSVSVSAYAGEKGRILARLEEGRAEEAQAACQELFNKLRQRRDLPYPKARELYCEIIAEVFRKADSLHLQIKEAESGEAISWVVRIESFNLEELHAFLCGQVSLLFAAMEDTRNEKRQILAIKDFIAQHYAEDSLSISDISVFLHMSPSHVCTMFKKETGDTINNYLTEYRLNKAKQHLDGTLLSVSDISAKVGYKDNSYFGRIFRKRFGMTPNEYRNR